MRVALDTTPAGIRISTVFLGLDYNFGDGKPLLFETMTFNHKKEGEEFCERWHTWDEVIAGHQGILKEILERESK